MTSLPSADSRLPDPNDLAARVGLLQVAPCRRRHPGHRACRRPTAGHRRPTAHLSTGVSAGPVAQPHTGYRNTASWGGFKWVLLPNRMQERSMSSSRLASSTGCSC